jgi:dTDP-4-dehydrorhamnose reductase
MIAEATAQILAMGITPLISNFSRFTDISGIYNLTGSGQVSWFGFAKAICERATITGKYSTGANKFSLPRLIPVPAEEYQLLARRPKNSQLASDRIRNIFGITIPAWQRMLDLCMQEIGDG